MAGVYNVQILQQEVLKFSLRPNQRLGTFSIPEEFKQHCKTYLDHSPHETYRFATKLNFEGFIRYNYYRFHERPNDDYNNPEVPVAIVDDIDEWRKALECVQRYCLNLLLAPKRKDFHSIKLSTAYYQYNIAFGFKGAAKIFEEMGYSPKPTDTRRPVVSLNLEKLPTVPENKAKLAKVVVELVLYDLELVTLKECIDHHNEKYRHNQCSIIDALEARRNTTGGSQEALDYLYNSLRKKSADALDPTNHAKGLETRRYDKQSGNQNKLNPSAPAINSNVSGSDGYYTPSSSVGQREKEKASQKAESSFPRVDPRDLPPPDVEDNNPSVDFVSTIPHTNPSSDFDDDQLIPGSTHLGYRNPPKTNSNPLAGAVPTADPQVTTVPTCTPPVTTASSSTKYPPTIASSHERDKLGHSSGASQYDRNQPTFGAQNDFLREGTQQDYLRSTSHGSGDGLHSFPTSSVRSTAGNFPSIGNQRGGKSPSVMYTRQKSSPASPNSGEMTVPFTTSAVTSATVMTSVASTTVSTVYSNVPGEPVSTTATVSESTTSTTSANPKLGKLNLNNLRKRTKQQTDEATANLNVQVSHRDKQDFSTVKKHLDQKKETTAQMVDKIAKPKQQSDYANVDDFSPAARAAAKLDNPADKPPVAAPRLNKDSEHVEYWQCACCEAVNEVKRVNCKKCKMTRGSFSASKEYCRLCNLKVYIAEEKMNEPVACPMCRDIINAVTVV